MREFNILQVEDNEGDILLFKEAIEDTLTKVNLLIARNGREAVEYLNNCSAIPSFTIPDLIVLDINMPKLNGHQVLTYCKNSEFKEIPIIILSTSSSPNDIFKAYNEQANCYIAKPVDVLEYVDTVRAIEQYWLNFCQLPLSFKE